MSSTTSITSSSVALAGCGLDTLIEIGASTVVLWELSGTGEVPPTPRAGFIAALAAYDSGILNRLHQDTGVDATQPPASPYRCAPMTKPGVAWPAGHWASAPSGWRNRGGRTGDRRPVRLVALFGDAPHNVSDVSTNLAVFIGFRVSRKTATER